MNHLIVGLGGTGGKVVAAFRRLVFQQFRKINPADLALDYLYIDSSEDDAAVANINTPLKEGDLQWRTLGQSVQLSPAQVVHLKQGSFGRVIDQIDEYPAFQRWLGDPAIWKDIWRGAPNGIVAGGQLRRFGRFLFAQNAKQVVSALQDRFEAPSKRSLGAVEAGWTVHVVAGLAGGTGSGTLIDVLGQLRKLKPTAADAKIILYVVLPETERTSWAKENYYANGYAALAEINAMLVHALEPADVTGEGSYTSELPINNVFVVTNRNSNALVVNVDRVLPEVIAETLYQIVVASGGARAHGAGAAGGGAGSKDRSWRDMVTGENDLKPPEKDGDGKDEPDQRANRFISFGIKRVAVPHQEIREYATLSFLKSAMLQLAFNNWQDGLGFAAEERRFDAAAVARSDDNQVLWRVTDGHLLLERKALDNDPDTWRPLYSDFENAFGGKVKDIQATIKGDDRWLDPLDRFAEEYYEQKFRRLGAPEFYRVSERSQLDRARCIRDQVGRDLFGRWSSGERSAREVARILDELLVMLRERLTAADAAIQQNGRIEVDKAEALRANTAEFSTRGGRGFLIGGITYSRPLGLKNRGDILAQLHTARARQLAYGYMRRVLSLTLNELQALAQDVATVAERLDKAVELTDQRRAGRVPANPEADAASHLYKLYDRAHVRSVVKRLEQDKALQDRQSADLRAELIKDLGERAGFSSFAETISDWMLITKLEAQAEKEVEQSLKEQESPRDRILQGSIVQKLYEEYAGAPDRLRSFFGDRVREAGSFAQFDRTQEVRGSGTKSQQALVAFVPSEADLPESLKGFRADLARVIAESGQGCTVEIVDTVGASHEIVLLSLVNDFPLRSLQSLAFLEKEYAGLVKGGRGERKRMELHAEGDGRDLPALFPPDREEQRRRYAPYWFIAETAGLLEERRNPGSGESEVIGKLVDPDGRLQIQKFASTLADGPAKLDPSAGSTLRRLVDGHLGKLKHVDDRASLRKQLVERENAALEQADFDQTNPAYQALSQAVTKAREIVGA